MPKVHFFIRKELKFRGYKISCKFCPGKYGHQAVTKLARNLATTNFLLFSNKKMNFTKFKHESSASLNNSQHYLLLTWPQSQVISAVIKLLWRTCWLRNHVVMGASILSWLQDNDLEAWKFFSNNNHKL